MRNNALLRKRWFTLLILGWMVVIGILPEHAPPVALAQGCATGAMYRVSISDNGTNVGNGNSDPARISSDGRFIVFASDSDNLVANDTNGVTDIFVHDQLNCTTRRISLSSAGVQATGGPSTNPQISNDGRYVVYQSLANNLVSGDTNSAEDIFLRDRATNTTTRVSVTSGGVQGGLGLHSFNPVISGDGRFVAFESGANFVGGTDANGGLSDIYLRDLTANTTTLLSISTAGQQGNSESREPSISGDGSVVAYMSFSSNLVAGDTADPDIFVRDLINNTTTLASVASNGAQAPDNFAEAGPEVSADGRFVVFVSTASFDAIDDNGINDIYVRDRVTSITELVSLAFNGTSASDGESSNPSISTDGNLVTFESHATNLTNNDTENQLDIFLRNRTTDATSRISQNTTGAGGTLPSFRASISTDGRYIAFTSDADNLLGTGGDLNSRTDVFIFDRSPGSGAFFAPANLVVTPVSRSQINLVWVDNATNETGFSIERSENGIDGWQIIHATAPNVSTYASTGLICSARFYYRVRGFVDGDGIPPYDTVSAYTNPANASTFSCADDKLAVFQYQAGQASLWKNFSSPSTTFDRDTYTMGAPAATVGGAWIMGDWNTDSIKTPGVMATNGIFYYTNSLGPTSQWFGIWIGFQGGGRPVVAGRFDFRTMNDCIGVVDSGPFPPWGTAFALYYSCDLTNGTAPPLGVQWLSTMLPDSQGFTGTHQFCAGNFNNDRIDSVAIRRGAFVAFTDRAPYPPEPGLSISYSAFDRAQYLGTPEAPEGLFTCGDWNHNLQDSFGLYYTGTGNFWYRQDLDWNSGLWTTQQAGSPLGTTLIAAGSWR